MLVCVPNEYDGKSAEVNSVGLSIGKGTIEQQIGVVILRASSHSDWVSCTAEL